MQPGHSRLRASFPRPVNGWGCRVRRVPPILDDFDGSFGLGFTLVSVLGVPTRLAWPSWSREETDADTGHCADLDADTSHYSDLDAEPDLGDFLMKSIQLS